MTTRPSIRIFMVDQLAALDEHSLEAPHDAGQEAYLKTKPKNVSKNRRRKEE